MINFTAAFGPTDGYSASGLSGNGVPSTFQSPVDGSGQGRPDALPHSRSSPIDDTHDTPPDFAARSVTRPQLARRRRPLSPGRVFASSAPCHDRVTAASGDGAAVPATGCVAACSCGWRDIAWEETAAFVAPGDHARSVSIAGRTGHPGQRVDDRSTAASG
ncbi:hypothetical protein GCM10014719_14020 [Planomonospora parontospora subsp. antibiotica]|nr:hypothetical protein GCM10014719_14020 [Planomonospora parontospora subsp. antibiotica]GII13937.1 hypothetical protein Ppa05_06630 [Planomonospora parontospora subsp. antibiotica]